MTAHLRFPAAGALAALSLAAALPAAAQTEDPRPVITVAVQDIVTSGALDVMRERSNVGARVFHSIFEGLIDYERQEEDLPRKPMLATEWTQVDDLTVELKLREGVTFHNGDTLDADDVVFTFSPERFGLLPEQVAAVEAGETHFTAADGSTGKAPPPEVAAIYHRSWPLLDRVEKVDEMTVRFVTTQPDPTLIGRISRMGSEIYSEQGYREAESWLAHAQAPVGTGPYRVTRFEDDNILELEAFDAYWGGKPPIKTLRFVVVPEVASRVNGLLSGDYDFITDVPPDQIQIIEDAPGVEVVGGPITNHRLMVFDKHNGAMRDPRVRQAITHAIDRELIVDALWGGRTRVPAGLQWEYYGDMFVEGWEVPEYDLAKAKALLDEAGYDGEPIVMRVLNNYYTNQVSTAQINAEAFRQIGLNIDFQMKENWQQIMDPTGNRAIRDWSNSAPFPDPVASIVNQHCPNGGQQQSGEWENEEFNANCEILEKSMDHAARKAAFQRMLEIIEREDPGYTVLHQNVIFYGKRADIDWRWSGLQSMDFRAENFAIQPGN
ncbi:ABC transporter substrate-binding protein [Albimonas pacifica]|uniref:Peptide/nickel transport system substrate-binding protein n=1 Tax=Albimonas pacifica TaxID=1114924 RepID=A0A1I3J2E2_9RHOB|nr:ABC transporter substrate-binding protein [Albimonas pacifica]SFI54472.1 peptide/nickel transport system substrate-binding protein [Albimonas pacifica]